jgi:uncharacterized damage-inducible protein DinB
MSDLQSHFNHFLWATKKITAMLETMSEEQFNDKLDQEKRSIKEIVLHLISIYAYFSSQNEYRSLVALSESLDKLNLLNLMKELTKKTIKTFETYPDKTIPVKTKSGIVTNVTGFSLFHMVSDHFAYHRGQIVTIFKEKTNRDAVGTDYAQFLSEDNPDLSL